MPVKAKMFVELEDVRRRLAELGLTIEALLDVLRHYALSLNSQTDDHPSWGRGISPASEAVFALRSRMKTEGWTRQEEKGFALTVHPDGKLAVNIAKGDEGTGDPKVNVETSSEKGVCTEAAIGANQYLLDLPAPEVVGTNQRPTWYLLFRKKINGIHAELSLPVGLVDKHISLWRERIMLPVLPEDGVEVSVGGFDDGGFEVKLSRKK